MSIRSRFPALTRGQHWRIHVVTSCHCLVQDERSAFAQLTVRVRAVHRFAAYDSKGRLVAGDPDREVPVQDVWVFERAFKEGPTSCWRVAGERSCSSKGSSRTANPVSPLLINSRV
jgi:hypothetical protein